MEQRLKAFLIDEGGQLKRYLESKRSGLKAESNIKQIIDNFTSFVLWVVTNKYDDSVNIKKLIKNIITREFTIIRDYVDHLIATKLYKFNTIRYFLVAIGQCLKWFVLYVLKDGIAILAGMNSIIQPYYYSILFCNNI